MKRLLFMLVLLVSTPALGHNYYVSTSGNDSIGDGSMANPWRTVQYAVNQAYAGDTILVREGRYYESVIFPRSGTEESRIIVKAYPDENVYMDGSIAITGWEQCTSNEAGLTAGGLINVNYANIYKTKVKTVPTTLFENGQHCRTARWPDQTYGFGIDAREFQAVPTEAFGVSNAVKDNTHLNPQEDDSFWYSYLSKLNAEQLATYYNGAQLEIWLMFEGNYKQIKTITGHTNNSIVLESSLRRNLMTGDRYSIRNHPHALDSAGEFYCTPTTDAEGNYTLYLWPLNTNSLSSGIRKAASGHCFYAMDKDGITIDGLKIIGYSGRGILFSHETGSVHDNSYITVQNCTITDCGEDGIFIWVGPYAQIKNCSIARVGGRGAMVSTGSNAIIQGCDVVDSTDTCISFYGVKHGQIIDNRIYGSRGVHSNGSSCYVGCENILLARNIYYNKTNATFQDIKNVVVFANVIDGFGTEENRIGTWPDAYQGTSGYQLYLNNTFIRTARSNAAVFRLATIYAYNNLISGSAYWPNITHRSHNGWVGRWTSQTADSGWTLGEGSWQMPAGWMQPGGWAVATQAQYNSIFKDLDWDSYEIFDYSLADGDNPAVHTGRDIQQFLTDMGIKNLFPDFDFTKDISGNPWNSTPSMGAYEYVGGSGSVTPVTPPEITSHPADRSVSEGQTASFSVSATGSGLTYQWQKNRVNIAGATASSYTTPVLAINDNNNKYRCIVTNAGGSATSNEATLTVTTNAPVITSHPADRSVNEGQTASFSVSATGSGTLTYQWQKNQSNIAGATASSYTTPVLAVSDNNNKYRCIVTNAGGSATSNEATLTVITNAPVITSHPADRSVSEGQTASFSVSATGSGTLTYQWQKNRVNIAGATASSYTTPVLAINDNNNKYRCIVTNAGGSATSNEATLTVTTNAPVITSHPADRSVSEGQTASFSVSATGSGTLTYQWQKNRVNIAGATASSYTTPVLAINDNNNKYRCIVTNAGGSATSNEATLTVSLNIPVPVAHWLFNEPYQSTAVDIISGQTASLINDPNWGEAWARENAIRLDTGIQAMQIPMGKCRPESGTIALRIRPENTDSMQILFGHALNSMDNRIALYSAAGSLALGIGNVLQAGICTLTAGQSCLVTVTWDNTDYAVFVDSDLKSSGVFNGFLQLDTTADVGNYGVPESRSSGLGFRGLVEDVQLFSTALTAEKINALSLTHYVRENRLVEFVVNGVDLEGNPISYTAPNLPSGATFNIATQTFSWHPSLYNQAGNYAVVFTAPDQPDHIVTVSVLDTNVAEWYVNFLESAGID